MFKSPSMPIGTNDFTLEYFGNLYGAISSNTPLIFNANAPYAYSKGCLLIYEIPKGAVRWIIFEKPSSGDPFLDSIELRAGAQESILHLALTRNGTTVKVYINGELKATKEQSAVKDLGDFRLGMANSSNMVMSRIYNYALSAEEVVALYNDGDPAGYVLPIPYKYKVANYISDFSKNTDGWSTVANYPGTSLNSGDGILSIYGDSTTLAIQKQDLSSGDKPSIFRIRIVFVEPFQGSRIRFFAHSFNDYADLTLSSEKLNAEGVVHIKNASNTVPNSFMYSYDVPIGDVVKISTITIESVGCVAEYLPQNLKNIKIKDMGFTPKTFEFDMDSPYYQRVLESGELESGRKYRVDYVVEEWDIAPAVMGSCGISCGVLSTDGTQYWLNISAAKLGENQYVVVDTKETGTPYMYVYGSDPSYTHTSRRLKVTVHSVKMLVDAMSWLDSARQIPLNDEYLPPLLQSDGGYDLTANGTPEIIIK